MGWQAEYQKKLMTADEALRAVEERHARLRARQL